MHILYKQLGKAAFQKHNDPLDAALFYLAMKKKAVLWGLFRWDIVSVHVTFLNRVTVLISVPFVTKPSGGTELCGCILCLQVSA